MNYKDYYKKSIDKPDEFWSEQADKIHWYKKPEKIVSQLKEGHAWFEGGELNTCYLCLDKHVEDGNGDRVALIYDSPVTGNKRKYTFSELKQKTEMFAGGLKNMGVVKGDRVIIYMPMIPEALVAMLACARLGAIHSVVFGGFAPHELQVRIDDARPKVIVTASCGIEFTKIIPYMPIVRKAISLSEHKVEKVVYVNRPEHKEESTNPQEIEWNKAHEGVQPADCVKLSSQDILYILYTSGTTGIPKGIVRENGGHAVAMNFSMEYVYDCQPGDVFWAGSDIGWVVGHSYIVYAPLIRGCSTIVYEGKPVKTPDAGAFWRVISEYKVNHFFTAPTAFRAIKKEDSQAELLKDYDMSSLKALFVAGERLDPPTYEWLTEHVKLPVLDHWWQTETGWAIVANPWGIEKKEVKRGSSSLPVPGYDLRILDDEGTVMPPGESGNVAIKLPLPPSCLNTLWMNHQNYVKNYLSMYEGYYLTGDGGYIDEDGYVFIMGRIDDVINVAGHRLSTGEMEEIISGHPSIAECAVIGLADDLKGEIPIGFYVLKDGIESTEEEMEKELVQMVRENIGAIAVFKTAIHVGRLPKTRSGKILRKTIRKLTAEEKIDVPSTIDDPAIIDEIKNRMIERKVGQYNS